MLPPLPHGGGDGGGSGGDGGGSRLVLQPSSILGYKIARSASTSDLLFGELFGPHASDPVFTTSSSDSGGSNHAL